MANNQDGEILKLIRENFDVFYTFGEGDIKNEKKAFSSISLKKDSRQEKQKKGMVDKRCLSFRAIMNHLIVG